MPSAARDAALIRPCQPGPPSRNFASESGSNRNVTCYFARLRKGGRPFTTPFGPRWPVSVQITTTAGALYAIRIFTNGNTGSAEG